eukprot:jgi/Ulvmu1/3521/UM163_0002.1
MNKSSNTEAVGVRCSVFRRNCRPRARSFPVSNNAARTKPCRLGVHAAAPSKHEAATKQTNTLGAIIGGAGLVTGSTVGAGILALPAVTHSTGFGPTTTLLLVCWAVLQLEALLLVEVNLACHRKLSKADPQATIPPILLADMTRLTLGSVAEASVSSIYLTMSFTLLLAYTSRAGELISSSLPAAAAPLGPLLFTAPLAAALISGGTPLAEKSNRALTALLLVVFAVVVGTGFSHMPWATDPLSHASWADITDTLPIMFLSLVYHDLIPVVCKFLGWRRSHILAALLLGSAIPLGMFVAFEAVTLGLVGPTVVGDPVDVLIATGGPFAGTALATFSLAALATSAIGTTLSLSSFFGTKLRNHTTLPSVQLPSLPRLPRCSADRTARTDTEKDGEYKLDAPQLAAVLLTLVPPTAMSLSNSDIFMTATHVAGAYGMTALYGLLPPALAWAAREGRAGAADVRSTRRLLPGGRLALLSLGAMGCVVEGLQLRADLGLGEAAVPAGVQSALQPVYAVASAGGGSFTDVSINAATSLSASLML